MTERTAVLVATVFVVAAALVSSFATDSWRGFYFPMSEGLLGLATGVAGAVIAKAQPRHAVGRILLWAGLTAATAQLLAVFASGPVSDPATSSGAVGAAVSIFQFAALTLLTAMIARFPDGDWTTGTAKWMFVLFAALVAGHLGLLVGAAVGVLGSSESVDAVRSIAFRVFPWVGLALTVHVVVHLLRSDPIRRRQIALVLSAFLAALVPEALIEGLDLDLGVLGGLVRGLLVLLIPGSVVVAVTRHRLYEIDRILSRTVSYGIVIGVMALTYLVVVLGLGWVLDLGGDTEVALATLAAVAISVPLVQRVRTWVDRRFFRSRYDAASVVARLADDLRTTVDLDEVEQRTESVMDEVFAPEEMSVWLAERTTP